MSIRNIVQNIYENYQNRNLQAVLDALPDDFCFEWPFDSSHAKYSGVCHTKVELFAQLEKMAADFEFNSYKATHILTDGDNAAAQVSLNVTSRKTGDTFDASIAHFWTFENGNPVKLTEYMDTALMRYQCD